MRCHSVLRIAVLMAVPFFAASAQAEPKFVEEGKLTYGTAATFAPFEYQADGKLTGFDIELGAALAEKMGRTPNILNMEFKGLIPALQGGRLDIINSAMYINPERAKQVDFVPYLKIGNEIVVAKGNPKKIMSRDDLCGMTIAVTLGGIQEKYAREDADKCAKAGKGEVTVMTLPTAQDSALTVRQGRADAFFNSTPGAIKQVTELPDVFEVTGETFEANTQIGIAVRKGDTETKAAIEKALMEVNKDGTFDKLVAKYRFPQTVKLF